jgi:hypothetical protein
MCVALEAPDSSCRSSDNLNNSAKSRLLDDKYMARYCTMLKGVIPHSIASQVEGIRSVALVILTDFAFTTYKASGALRYANHTRPSTQVVLYVEI